MPRETRSGLPLPPPPFPEDLARFRAAGVPLEGEALRFALRRWFADAPEWRGRLRYPDERIYFLRWAIGGRVLAVLADLDASDAPEDHEVAAAIREMGTWPIRRGSGGIAQSACAAQWGYIGRALGHPDWQD